MATPIPPNRARFTLGEADVLRVQSLLSLSSGDMPRAQGAIARPSAGEGGPEVVRQARVVRPTPALVGEI